MVYENDNYSDETYVEGMKKEDNRLRGSLKFLKGIYKNKIIKINKPTFTIGRSNDCDLCIKRDKRISRIHAQLTDSLGKIIIEDLGSSNGTKVNGHTISKRILKSGDILELGDTLLEFSSNN